METFTGWEYLLIDACNQFGGDKWLFKDRIQWGLDNLTNLEALAEDCPKKERPLYIKAVMAIRDAQAGRPIGHIVGFDAVCSGMQLMSAITGCHSGARATGLIDPDVRSDAYSECTDRMSGHLGLTVSGLRNDVKQAVMTSLYGSKKEPKNLFGEETSELEAFYKAMFEMAPGACELLEDLRNSWQPFALSHDWELPDGYQAKVRVMETIEKRIEIDELDHATFTYVWEENNGAERGISNVANVVHSIDAYVLRSLIRRCSYDPVQVRQALTLIEIVLLERTLGAARETPVDIDRMFESLLERYRATNMVDVRIIQYLEDDNIALLTSEHLRKLSGILNTMIEYQPFPVVPVHDQFGAHPNNLNEVRYWYKEILAELAESDIIQDILCQLHKVKATYTKRSNDLADKIRGSNYSLS